MDLLTHNLRAVPLPTALGPDAVAAGATPIDDVTGGSPLRCCLRDARPGERIVLIAVETDGPRGPYAERGPVFVHAHDCGGPSGPGYPEDWRARTQVFRVYDQDGRILGGEVVEPAADHEGVAARLLADPAAAFLHTRNVVFGCFMCRIDRIPVRNTGSPGTMTA